MDAIMALHGIIEPQQIPPGLDEDILEEADKDAAKAVKACA